MQFENVSKRILKELLSKGYNILTSNESLSADVVYWYPEKVENVNDYLIHLDIIDAIEPLKEPNILVIQDALDNIEDEDLIGLIFIP